MNYLYRFLLRDDLMNIFFLAFSIVDSYLLILVIKNLDTNILLLPDYSQQVKTFLGLIIVLSWVLSVFIVSMVQTSNLNRFVNFLRAIGAAGIIYGIGIVSLISIDGSTLISFNQSILIFLVTFFVFLINRVGFFISYKIITYSIKKKKTFVIIGDTPTARRLTELFSDSSVTVKRFRGIFDNNTQVSNELRMYHLGGLNDVKKYCLENKVDEIYYTLPNQKEYLNDLRRFADDNFIFLGIVPDLDLDEDFKLRTHIIDHKGIPVLSYERSPLSLRINRFTKRMLDVAVSGFALLLLSVTLFPLIAIAIKLTSKGPVFFKQLRSGKNCEPFWCYKFRTMKVNSEANFKQATKNDSRITPVGSFLRKTSLDELPQFFNVFRGDMSVVGPRPHMIAHTEQYSAAISKFKVRHSVEAGITGYAQINGYRGETKELSQMEQRVLFDKWYLENWSIFLDIQIIFKTFINIFKGEKMAY